MNEELDQKNGQAALMAAASTGDVETVRTLLAPVVSVNVADEGTGDTPLRAAVRNGHVEVVKLLLEECDVRIAEYEGKHEEPLIAIAVKNGDEEMLEALVTAGMAEILEEEEYAAVFRTAMEMKKDGMVESILGFADQLPCAVDTAIACGRKDLALSLVEKFSVADAAAYLGKLGAAGDADVVARLKAIVAAPKRKKRIAYSLCTAGALAFLGLFTFASSQDIMEFGIEKDIPCLVSFSRALGAKVEAGRTSVLLLRKFIEEGDADGVRRLLEYGASPCDSRIISAAYKKGDPEIMRLLLEHGMDPNAVRIHTLTVVERSKVPLTIARSPIPNRHSLAAATVYSQNKPMLDVLVEHGAKVTTDEVPLLLTCCETLEDIKMLEALGVTEADFQADPAATLRGARINDNMDAVRYFVEEKGVSLQAVPDILLSFAGSGDVETVRYFLDKGIDINFRDEEGGTALMYAALAGNVPVVKFLLEKGADTTVTEFRGLKYPSMLELLDDYCDGDEEAVKAFFRNL